MAQRYMNEELGTRPCSFSFGNKLIGFSVQCGTGTERRSQVRPICSILEQWKPWTETQVKPRSKLSLLRSVS